MLKISGNELCITKGDSAFITVNIEYADGQPYEMKSGDKLKLSAKNDINGSVLMAVESSTNTIHILPSDTKNLVPGKGFFDIQLKSGSEVYTLVGVTNENVPNLTVYPEVTED